MFFFLNRKSKPGLAQGLRHRGEATGRPEKGRAGLKLRERYAAQAVSHTVKRTQPPRGQRADPGRQDGEWAPIRHGLL